jgi:hypothetical protein
MHTHLPTVHIPVPKHMQHLPVYGGIPVPWFVDWVNGVPDFRIADRRKFVLATSHRGNHCWVCGTKMQKHCVFVIGSMCAMNRVTSEPPCHFACAEYSARVCPFLSRPVRFRRATNLPDGFIAPPGVHSDRNPGVMALWTTKSYELFQADQGSGAFLFDIGDPEEITWMAEGRLATRSEVIKSVGTGLPFLEEEAREGGANDILDLAKMVKNAARLLERFLPSGEQDFLQGIYAAKPAAIHSEPHTVGDSSTPEALKYAEEYWARRDALVPPAKSSSK